MLKVLLVEDNADKRNRVYKALGGVNGMDVDAITDATDLRSARLELKRTAYDLLILDIALPLRPDLDIEADAGLKLLDDLRDHPEQYKVPEHVIGLTGFAEIFGKAAYRFSRRLLTLVQYDPASEDWQLALQARVRHILDAKAAQSAEDLQYKLDLAVLCALPTPELSSLRALDWDWIQISVPGDHTIYWRGQFDTDRGKRSVVAAAASQMGMPAAAILASKMIGVFRPRYLAMTGIAAGVRDKVRMGDILVANPSWDWGSGKWTLRNGDAHFEPAPRQIQLAPILREQFRGLAQDPAIWSRVKNAWPANRPPHDLQIRIGPVASGAAVLGDRTTARRVLEQHRELLGIEMETYGVYAAADEAGRPRPLAFSLKSVVDFADSNKDDEFQAYGAYTSAEALREFAERYI
jgi:nucleoside phosphorylase/CheY-like chemotaxis protein